VLIQKSRSYAEIYNDMDQEVVNVFRVMRDPYEARVLVDLLRLTPFARDEYEAAYHPPDDVEPVERARLTIIKSFMGFGSAAIHDHRPRGMRTRAAQWRAPTGFRSNAHRSGTTPAHDWDHYPDQLQAFCTRLQGVVIENRPALEVIEQHAREDAVIYCDPPYPHSARSGLRWPSDRQYSHEMADDDHRALAEVLRATDAKVIISGYPCGLYDEELYPDWHREMRGAQADSAKARTEVLWINRAAEQLRLL
jgi:DNA adenine methylase